LLFPLPWILFQITSQLVLTCRLISLSWVDPYFLPNPFTLIDSTPLWSVCILGKNFQCFTCTYPYSWIFVLIYILFLSYYFLSLSKLIACVHHYSVSSQDYILILFLFPSNVFLIVFLSQCVLGQLCLKCFLTSFDPFLALSRVKYLVQVYFGILLTFILTNLLDELGLFTYGSQCL